MKIENKVIGLSVILGLSIWLIDAVLDYLFFYEGSFLELLISGVPTHEVYIRSLVVAIILFFGLLISRLLAMHRRVEERTTELISTNRKLELEITKRNRAEILIARQSAVSDAVNQVFRKTLTCETEEEVGKTCLAVCEELTGSKFGFIGELNSASSFDTIAISNPGWDACTMPGTDAVNAIENMKIRGIDRSTIREGKSWIVNDLVSHPDQVGNPKGHPVISSFLVVPLKEADKIIGMIGLGNKETGYDTADQEEVETMSVAIVVAFRRKRVEEQIKASLKEKEVVLKEIHHRVKTIYRSFPVCSTMKMPA